MAVLATTSGVPLSRTASAVEAADDVKAPRPGLRERASVSLDQFERRRLVGRLVLDKRDFPKGVVVGYRDLNAREMTPLPSGPLSEGGNTIPVSIPVPGRGELRIADADAPHRASFVAIAVEPVVPMPKPHFIYGPSGRSQVLLRGAVPPELRYLVFTSPSIEKVPGRGLVGDAVRIACLASDAHVKEALVGLTPLPGSSDGPVGLSLYDEALGRWRRLKSHTASTGTVFARGPIPGTYGVTEQQP